MQPVTHTCENGRNAACAEEPRIKDFWNIKFSGQEEERIMNTRRGKLEENAERMGEGRKTLL